MDFQVLTVGFLGFFLWWNTVSKCYGSFTCCMYKGNLNIKNTDAPAETNCIWLLIQSILKHLHSSKTNHTNLRWQTFNPVYYCTFSNLNHLPATGTRYIRLILNLMLSLKAAKALCFNMTHIYINCIKLYYKSMRFARLCAILSCQRNFFNNIYYLGGKWISFNLKM
jgi:hypothetical protein